VSEPTQAAQIWQICRTVLKQHDSDLQCVTRAIGRDLTKCLTDAGMQALIPQNGGNAHSPEFILAWEFVRGCIYTTTMFALLMTDESCPTTLVDPAVEYETEPAT